MQYLFKKMIRVRTHGDRFLEFYVYPDGDMNVYSRTREQVVETPLAVDGEEAFGGWAIDASQARKLQEFFDV